MALNIAYISEDVYFSMFYLALSNDKLEVLSMLIGETKEEKDVKSVHVYTMVIPLRLTRQHDRVEASPEQLFQAVTEAEKLSKIYNRELRVIGWFHSHPHITVWPSDVDLKTQRDMQTMEMCFVGIIASVFCCDKKSKENQITLTCFQTKESADYSCKRVCIPLHVVPDRDNSFTNAHLKLSATLPTILLEEEAIKYRNSSNETNDCLTKQFNSSVFTMSAVQIQETLTKPLMKTLEIRTRLQQRRPLIEKKLEEMRRNNEQQSREKDAEEVS
uniref:Lys-63-specific deubiquitinase BRCC36 n=1 Tax=Cacopsylla melanoneura TaxID=428564 RepID=A0A8D8TIB5_9HEMI